VAGDRSGDRRQALGASIQSYAIFDEIPQSERILSVLALINATVQIVASWARSALRLRAQDDTVRSPASVVVPDPQREPKDATPQAK
jgi:hypothetical protein